MGEIGEVFIGKILIGSVTQVFEFQREMIRLLSVRFDWNSRWMMEEQVDFQYHGIAAD